MSTKNIKKPADVKLFFGILYPNKDGKELSMVKTLLEKRYGKFDAISEEYDFSDITKYYDDELGSHLKKRIFVCSKMISPEKIAGIKTYTNKIEDELSHRKDSGMCRTINIDPGYFGLNNIVLASTKNFAHRTYLKKGIYSELTLIFRKDRIITFDWTYPDFKSELIKNFFWIQRTKLLNTMAKNRVRG